MLCVALLERVELEVIARPALMPTEDGAGGGVVAVGTGSTDGRCGCETSGRAGGSAGEGAFEPGLPPVVWGRGQDGEDGEA